MSHYLGGIPYEPDIRKLMESFGVPEIGSVIKYEQMAVAIATDPQSHRFRGVLTAWLRRLLREHNVEGRALRGIGIEFMVPNERVDEGARRSRLNARQLGRITRKVGMVPAADLDALHLQIRDHIVITNQRLLVEAGERDKRRAQIAVSEAYKQLPRKPAK